MADDNIQDQRQLEREARDRAEGQQRSKDKREKQIGISGLSATTAGAKLKAEAIERVVDEIKKRMAEQESHNAKQTWYKAVRHIPLEEVAEIGLITCLDSVGHGWTWNATLKHAGRALHMAQFTSVMRGNRQGRRMLAQLESKARLRCTKYNDRVQYVMRVAKARGFDFDAYSPTEYDKIGGFLIDVVHTASDIVEVRLIKTSGDPDKEKWPNNVLTLTDDAAKKLEEHNEYLDGLTSLFSPMTAPPMDWPSVMSPYLDPRTSFLVPMVKKMWSPEQKADIQNAIDSGSMDDCIEALNLIQNVPYEINEYIVQAVRWTAGYPAEGDGEREAMRAKVGKFPNLKKVGEENKPENWDDLSRKDKAVWHKANDKAKRLNSEVNGLMRVMSNTLADCKDLRGHSFWMPHQFDKRGRIYHTSTFGHHNTDYIRAMFLFANRAAVDDSNAAYLELQLANSWGNKIDKRSLKERQDWVDENYEAIYNSGKDFVAHVDFWTQADEPFQFLAACHEYANAVDAIEKGEVYYSGLPIALDATQSGIQHFAASLLNEEDGTLVNLTQQDKPNDVYEACMIKAQKAIDDDIKDFKQDAPISDEDDDEEKERKLKRQKWLRIAETLNSLGGLTRKIVKRNVMTWAYSSRQYGLAKQLRDDWLSDYEAEVDRGEREEHPFGDDAYAASFYIAGKNEDAISKTVKSASVGMKFFRDCAAILAEENKHIRFVTPLGFPVHQYYREERKVKDPKTGQWKSDPSRQRMYLTDKATGQRKNGAKNCTVEYLEEVATTQSINASAPNIIHSMDATHLMITALLCQKNDVHDLMVVHDSFATSLGSIKTLAWAVRRAFVDLYSDYNLYEDFRNQCAARLDDPDRIARLPAVPDKGTLKIEGVLLSDYCFS